MLVYVWVREMLSCCEGYMGTWWRLICLGLWFLHFGEWKVRRSMYWALVSRYASVLWYCNVDVLVVKLYTKTLWYDTIYKYTHGEGLNVLSQRISCLHVWPFMIGHALWTCFSWSYLNLLITAWKTIKWRNHYLLEVGLLFHSYSIFWT